MSAAKQSHPLPAMPTPSVLILESSNLRRIAHIGRCFFVGDIAGERHNSSNGTDIDIDQKVGALDLSRDPLQRLIAVIARSVWIAKDQSPSVVAISKRRQIPMIAGNDRIRKCLPQTCPTRWAALA